MRAAYVCADPGVPAFGHKGCSVHVQEMLRALRGAGVRVELIATRLGGPAPTDLRDLHVHRLPTLPKGDLANRERAARAANGSLRDALEAAGPYDFVYERYSLWSFAGVEYARSCGVPGLLEVNAPLVDEQIRHRQLADRNAAEAVAARAFGGASHLIAVSDGVARYLRRFAPGHVHVIPNGVDLERFLPRSAANAAQRPTFVIGFTGSLKPWHGLRHLAEAFARLHRSYPGARLLIVGHGPAREELERDLRHRSLDHVAHFTGAVPPTEVPDLLALMDVAVAPYSGSAGDHGFYFSPLKLYEYMAAGLPVVASRVGQLEQLIEHDKNGLLCPAGDAEALAAALARLHDQPLLRRQLGLAARATVIRSCGWRTVAERILTLVGRAPARTTTPVASVGV